MRMRGKVGVDAAEVAATAVTAAIANVLSVEIRTDAPLLKIVKIWETTLTGANSASIFRAMSQGAFFARMLQK